MAQSILFTQCLQNDFVRPIARYEPLPNLLHVGSAEARRLMGEDPAEGPVARVMEWAYAQPAEQLALIHIRDWHDPDDARQSAHLRRFGHHCIAHTPGAEFAFNASKDKAGRARILNALTLNDFHNTGLDDILHPFDGQPVRVGIIGVWTEAKVTFLAYELSSRYPGFQIGICPFWTSRRAARWKCGKPLRGCKPIWATVRRFSFTVSAAWDAPVSSRPAI